MHRYTESQLWIFNSNTTAKDPSLKHEFLVVSRTGFFFAKKNQMLILRYLCNYLELKGNSNIYRHVLLEIFSFLVSFCTSDNFFIWFWGILEVQCDFFCSKLAIFRNIYQKHCILPIQSRNVVRGGSKMIRKTFTDWRNVRDMLWSTEVQVLVIFDALRRTSAALRRVSRRRSAEIGGGFWKSSKKCGIFFAFF